MLCRMNIILDLDETLFQSNLKEDDKSPETTLKRETIIVADQKDPINKYAEYNVYLRPYLETFLDYLFDNFNVGVLTYGGQNYAYSIVKNILQKTKHRKLSFLFYESYRRHAKENGYHEHKDLKYIFERIKPLNVYPCNTLLIDNDKHNTDGNLTNSIRVPDFMPVRGKDRMHIIKYEEDKTLLGVIEYLEKIRKDWEAAGKCTHKTLYSGCRSLKQPLFEFIQKVRN
jgi:hypothetical protein